MREGVLGIHLEAKGTPAWKSLGTTVLEHSITICMCYLVQLCRFFHLVCRVTTFSMAASSYALFLTGLPNAVGGWISNANGGPYFKCVIWHALSGEIPSPIKVLY